MVTQGRFFDSKSGNPDCGLKVSFMLIIFNNSVFYKINFKIDINKCTKKHENIIIFVE